MAWHKTPHRPYNSYHRLFWPTNSSLLN